MTLSNVFAYHGGWDRDRTSPTVVLVHGAGMDHAVWRSLSRYLAAHGFRVLAVDLPGHGRSSGPPNETVGAIAEWLLMFSSEVGADRFSLIGHSLGGLVSLRAAAEEPGRIDRLILLAAATELAVHPELLAYAESGDARAVEMIISWSFGTRGRLGGGSSDPGTSPLVAARRILEAGLPSSLAVDLRASASYSTGVEDASSVSCPTLVIAGTEDRMVPLAGAASLADLISGAVLEEVRGGGHMLTIDSPRVVRKTVMDFLSAC